LIRHLTRLVDAAQDGRRLDESAQEWLGHALGREVSRSEVRRWIMAGAVRMEGAPLRRPGILVVAGRRLDAALRPQEAERTRVAKAASLGPADILFEDAWLVAVGKPAGIPTHETADPRRPHLVGLLTRLLSGRTSTDPGRDEVRLGIHQRLDRDTSGVILFTKERAADADLARQFAERRIAKTYHALTAATSHPPPREWSTHSPISSRPSLTQEARTDFRLLEALPGGLLVEARPRTGRKHQIRIHLAEGGHPILGDERYGRSEAASPSPPRLMLHAFRLELRHPLTGLPLAIESPWPADFRRMLDLLRAEPSASLDAPRRRSRR
jgi:RluA family pseudouridine synthase